MNAPCVIIVFRQSSTVLALQCFFVFWLTPLIFFFSVLTTLLSSNADLRLGVNTDGQGFDPEEYLSNKAGPEQGFRGTALSSFSAPMPTSAPAAAAAQAGGATVPAAGASPTSDSHTSPASSFTSTPLLVSAQLHAAVTVASRSSSESVGDQSEGEVEPELKAPILPRMSEVAKQEAANSHEERKEEAAAVPMEEEMS
jgi:hypothetical protein